MNYSSRALVAALLLGLSSCTFSAATPHPSPSASEAPLPTPPPGGLSVRVCPPPPDSHQAVAAPTRSFTAAPARTIATDKGYCAYVHTAAGVISIRLRPDVAPNTVNDFVFLVRQGFYDGLKFHRVCRGLGEPGCGNLHIAQSGDPGSGGPGYTIPREPVTGSYLLGSVAMAGDASINNGSQFFIVTGDVSSLDKVYNLFGQVTDGILVAAHLRQGDVIDWVDVEETPL